MAKQGSGNQSLKWILIVASALVLVAAVVLGIVLLGGNQSGPAGDNGKVKLYWNVERSAYVGMGVNGTSGRMPRSDGYYYVRFAVGGEQVDLMAADYDLIQKIDQLDVMGLEFDEQGIIIGVNTVNECTGGLVAAALYVQSVDGNTLVCNTQGTYKGITVEVELTEETEVYDVGQTELLCGIPGDVGVDDEILAVKDYDGKIIYVFTKGYTPPGDVYWNITRMYDSSLKLSTREMDVTGTYTFEMAYNGQVVTLQTKDTKVANAIDAKAAKCTGLEFDENGYIIGVSSASKVSGGTTFASWANVFEIGEDEVLCRKLTGSLAGTEYLGTLSQDCKIINVSGIGGPMGSYTTLQYGDQVHGLTDNRGRVCYLWVVSRLAGEAGYKLYWNVERKYDSTAKTTKRYPAADGYYYIPVATGGQQIMAKTNDKTMASKLDSYAARCFTMKLDENNVILDIQGSGRIHGGGTFGSWYYVDEIDGKKLTVSRILTGDTEPTILTGTMADDVEIINGSKLYSKYCGEYGELKVGDRIHCLTDLEGKVRVIFIVEKTVPGPLYWNITKKSVSNGVTTRQRADDGYFYFEMAGNGKQYTFKTKDLSLATEIDSYVAKCMGLTVTADGVILKTHGATAVDGCQGGTKSLSWVDVLSISGRTIVAQKDPNSNVSTAGKIFSTGMAYHCKVYNVSGNFDQFCGEETTLRKGDRIHALHDRNGQATVIFVVDRAKPLNEKNACPCATNPTWEPWDGTTPLQSGKYYYLTADVVAPTEGFILEGENIYLRLDGHTISSDGRCFFLKGGRLNICDHTTRGKLIGSGVKDAEGNEESGGVIRVFSSSATLNLWNVDLERAESDVVAKEGGLISCSGTVSLYDCNLIGGKATVKGGAVQVSLSGTFRMFGGSVTGGKAPTGSNLNIAGKTYLENVTVSGGQGKDICVSSDFECVLNTVKIDELLVTKGNVTLNGNVQIPQLVLSGGKLIDGGVQAGSQIELEAKPTESQVVMTGASQTAFDSLTSFDPQDYVLSYDSGKKTVTVTCVIEPKTHEQSHCACVGTASGLEEHTCTELTDWILITDEVFEDAIGTDGSVTGLKFKQDGNYYLSLDYALTKTICIMPGQNITICLNGCDLSRSSYKTFLVAGTLNITDCTGGGKVIGADPNNGGAVKLVSQGTVNLFAGTLTTTASCVQGGGVVVISTDGGKIVDNSTPVASVFNMYGGTITGGTANGGGNVALWHATYFNMYGGTISGGTSGIDGGNLQIRGTAQAKAQLLGGTITGGSADTTGAGISLVSGQLVIGGNMQITGNDGADLHVGNAVVSLQNYTSDAITTVSMDSAGVFATCDSDLSQRFQSADDTYEVKYSAGKLKLDLSASAEGHIHCICGGTAEGLHAHECTNLIYEPWDGTTALSSGNYYLTQDVELTEASGILVGNMSINLCLDGHKITNNNGRAFYLASGSGVLNLCDHADHAGAIEAVGVANESGGLVRIGSPNASFGAYNVTMRRIDTDTRVKVSEGGVITCAGKIQLYNCSLENGYAAKGGSLNMVNISKGVVVGCTFQNGQVFETSTTSTGTGGNIRIGGNTTNDPATLTMIDCTVTGGQAELAGDGVYVNPDATRNLLYLGGTINITGNHSTNLYLGGGDTVRLMELDAASTIGITMVTNGAFTESATDLSACFIPDQNGLEVTHNGTHLVLGTSAVPSTHTDHCVCAGKTEGVGDHVCATLTQWKPFTPDVLKTATSNSAYKEFIEGGNYYLTEDLALTQELVIPTDMEVTLCLNGYTLTGSKRMFRINGTVNITDCSAADTGKIIGSATLAPVFYGYAGGHLNLYGGELSSANTNASGRNWGGVGALSNDKGMAAAKGMSTMTMYGGKIVGTSVVKSGTGSGGTGGALGIMNGASFTMHGGQIVGGSAEVGGAAIVVNGGCTAKLLGGSILSGGQAEKLVYTAATNADLVVGGSVQIENVFLAAGDVLTVSAEYPLTNAAQIAISMAEPGVFVTVSKEEDHERFIPWNSGYNKMVTENAGKYDLALEAVAHEGHCICSETAEEVGEHVCDDTMIWKPFSISLLEQTKGTATSVQGVALTEDGYYYLTEDVVLTDRLCILPGQSIVLCLNGYEIARTGGNTIYVAGDLVITDCGEDGKVTSSYSSTNTVSNAGVIKLLAGSSMELYAATVEYTGTGVQNGGGIVVSGDKGNLTSSTEISTFTMYSGTITGGIARAGGGNLAVWKNCTFTMYGGTITGGSADVGGNIHANSTGCHVNLYGGVISDAVKGHDVYVANGIITVGDQVQIGDLYLPDGKSIAVSTEQPFTDGAAVGVSMANIEQAFTTVSEESIKSFFFDAQDPTKEILYNEADNGLYLS